jgi:hypothetical protein
MQDLRCKICDLIWDARYDICDVKYEIHDARSMTLDARAAYQFIWLLSILGRFIPGELVHIRLHIGLKEEVPWSRVWVWNTEAHV